MVTSTAVLFSILEPQAGFPNDSLGPGQKQNKTKQDSFLEIRVQNGDVVIRPKQVWLGGAWVYKLNEYAEENLVLEVGLSYRWQEAGGMQSTEIRDTKQAEGSITEIWKEVPGARSK